MRLYYRVLCVISSFFRTTKNMHFLKMIDIQDHLHLFVQLPSRELTYPPNNGILKMIFLFTRWDMLIPWISWRVHLFLSLKHRICEAKLRLIR